LIKYLTNVLTYILAARRSASRGLFCCHDRPSCAVGTQH